MGAQGPQLVRVALHQDAERHLKVASDDAVAGGSHQDLTAFPLRQRPDVPVHLGHLRQWGNKDQRLFGVGIQRVAESGIPRPRSPFSGRKDPTGPVGRPCHRQRRSFRPWGPGARRRVPRGRCAGFSTPTSILKRQPGNRKTGWEDRPMGRGIHPWWIPRDQMEMDPFESPVRTSPLSAKAKHVTYLGLSRCSRAPIFRDMVPFSKDQKQTCPFPHVTKE